MPEATHNVIAASRARLTAQIELVVAARAEELPGLAEDPVPVQRQVQQQGQPEADAQPLVDRDPGEAIAVGQRVAQSSTASNQKSSRVRAATFRRPVPALGPALSLSMSASKLGDHGPPREPRRDRQRLPRLRRAGDARRFPGGRDRDDAPGGLGPGARRGTTIRCLCLDSVPRTITTRAYSSRSATPSKNRPPMIDAIAEPSSLVRARPLPQGQSGSRTRNGWPSGTGLPQLTRAPVLER